MQKIFTGPGDKRLPPRVKKMPKKKREHWVAVWNNVFRRCMKDSRKKRSTCESQAFRIANGVVKTTNTNTTADHIENFLSFHNTAVTVSIDVNSGVLEIEQTI